MYDSDDMPEGRTTDHSLMETQTELKAHANYDAFVALEDNQESPAAEENGEDDEEEEEIEVEEEETEDELVEEGEAAQEDPKVDEAGRETHGQVSCYAGITMMLQHRSHLFMILICGPFARFIRWDRSSATVSERFDYTKKRTLIFNFYKCFAQLSPDQRGKDPSVSPLTDEDDDAIARAKFDLFDMDMWHGDAGPKPKRDIKIEDQKLLRIDMTFDNETRRFVVCAPKFDDGAFSPFGRSTRRSLAVDLDSSDLEDPEKPYEILLFMKDYWREDSPRTVEESGHLSSPRSTQRPPCSQNGDWQRRSQHGHDYTTACTSVAESAPGKPSPDLTGPQNILENYRQRPNDLLQRQELGDMYRGYDESPPGSVRQGVYFAPRYQCQKHHDHSRSPRIGRTGTWQFMSARLLGSFGTTHTLVDDRESSLWVLLYVALRYTPNSLQPVALHHDLKSWFQDSILGPRGDTGGVGKQFVLNDKQALPSFYVQGVNELLRELADVFAVRYQPEPSAEDDALYDFAKASSTPQMAENSPMGQYLAKIEKLNSPTWLFKTFRKHAKTMKVPHKRGKDWCKNACYSQEEF
ncbi:uncharacterized protein ARMOST_20997 [Armillaria ostoyae]|uniref:Fungal-type protein kinase domain-containing protein n=1 Tax=Armillaria ostoyae TaxID=47428 RepID=A0A284S8W1_ARMOS|nr:uncharacterized protein ARMOST_20997 [Armillaria ostoyae]